MSLVTRAAVLLPALAIAAGFGICGFRFTPPQRLGTEPMFALNRSSHEPGDDRVTRISSSRSEAEGEMVREKSVHHYEYVFPEGEIYIYDLDNGFKLVKHTTIPDVTGI